MKSRMVFQCEAKWAVGLSIAVLAAALIAAGQSQSQPGAMQQTSPILQKLDSRSPAQPNINVEMPPISAPLTIKQKDAIIKSNFKTTQRDVDKLSKLVEMLNTEMKKSNPNVLSMSIVRQANKIEKLAKKIKNEAKAY